MHSSFTLSLSFLAGNEDVVLLSDAEEAVSLLWLSGGGVRMLAVIRVSCAHGNQVLVQGDGLVQPLPGLVQRVDAVSNTHTIATAVNGHSFQLARRG